MNIRREDRIEIILNGADIIAALRAWKPDEWLFQRLKPNSRDGQGHVLEAEALYSGSSVKLLFRENVGTRT